MIRLCSYTIVTYSYDSHNQSRPKVPSQQKFAGVSKWNRINYTSNVNAVTDEAFIRNLMRESQVFCIPKSVSHRLSH